MLRITTTGAAVTAALGNLAQEEIPHALRLGINAAAKGAVGHLQDEMRRVFDRPTPFVLNALRVTKWATRDDLAAEIGFKSRMGKGGAGGEGERALTPHVPEFASSRKPKGAEAWLLRAGFLQRGEYLVPSRTCPLDGYGNVSASLMQKMLADVGAYRTAQGFNSTTRSAKARYVFGQVRGRSGRLVKGIWLVEGGQAKMATGRWHLMMLVVRKPVYQRHVTFDFYGEGEQYVADHLPAEVAAGVAHALAYPRASR